MPIAMDINNMAGIAITQSNKNGATYTATQYHIILVYT